MGLTSEARLNVEIERPANIVITKLQRSEFLHPEEREILCRYIGVMMMRTPYQRRKRSELFPQILPEVIESAHHQIKTLVTPDQFLHFSKEIERVHEKFRKAPPPEIIAQIKSPWPSEVILDTIRRMTWRIAQATGPSYFLTSDNPVFFFEAYGLGSAQSELTFPLCRDVALLGSYGPGNRETHYFPGSVALVKEINRRVASGAERFVFYAKEVKWIETLATREHPYLSRIQW